MLTGTTLRRTTTAASCHACAAIAAAAAAAARFPSRPTLNAKRYTATYAQRDDTAIEHDDRHDDTTDLDRAPPADEHVDPSPVQPRRHGKDRDRDRDDAVDWTQAHGPLDDLFKAFGDPSSTSTSTFATSPPSPSPSPSPPAPTPPAVPSLSATSPYKPSPIYSGEETPAPARAPVQTLDELIASPVDPTSGPILSDLERLRPTRFSIPSATSPDSHRLIYRRVWDATYDRVNSSFSKRQTHDLAANQLKLDVFSPVVSNRLKMGTTGKKPKWWKSKRLDQMSKRELIHAILVGEWDMIDPNVVPHSVRKGDPTVTEAVPLSDRTLFLLLSPNCPVIPKIANHFGIKVSFARHPETQVLAILLKGNKAGVASAREEIDTIDETTTRQELKLPKPATTLRPEVYQAMSKIAKTFIEPGQQPDTLVASAIEPKSLLRLERYLSGAFASHAVLQHSTSLFASVPRTALDHVRYALYPFEPVSPGATPGALESLRGTSAMFARLRTVDRGSGAARRAGQDDDADADAELDSWSHKMRLGQNEPVPIYLARTQEKDPSSSRSSILQALFDPFEAADGTRRGVAEGAREARYELRAELGHLVFPQYLNSNVGGAGGGRTADSLDGTTPANLKQTVEWMRDKRQNDTVWIPASSSIPVPLPAPASNLNTRDVSSPFSALFPDPPQDAAHDDVSTFPTCSSKSMRRFTYYPAQLPSAAPPAPSSPPRSRLPQRLEVVLDLDRAKRAGGGGQRGGDEQPFEISLIKESTVQVFVPNRSSDYRLKLRQSRPVALDQVQNEGQYQLEPGSTLFETWSQHPSQSPFELVYDGTTYILHTHSLLRQTLVSRPPPPPSPSSTPRTSSLEGYDVVQETLTHFLPEPMSSTNQVKTCEYVLTPSSSSCEDEEEGDVDKDEETGWTRDEIWNGQRQRRRDVSDANANANDEGGQEEESRGTSVNTSTTTTTTTKGWNQVLNELEQMC